MSRHNEVEALLGERVVDRLAQRGVLGVDDQDAHRAAGLRLGHQVRARALVAPAAQRQAHEVERRLRVVEHLGPGPQPRLAREVEARVDRELAERRRRLPAAGLERADVLGDLLGVDALEQRGGPHRVGHDPEVRDVERQRQLALVGQEDHRPAVGLRDGQLVEDVRVAAGEDGDAQVVVEDLPEHLGGDRAGLVEVVRADRLDPALVHRGLDDELEDVVGVLADVRAGLPDRADDESASGHDGATLAIHVLKSNRRAA